MPKPLYALEGFDELRRAIKELSLQKMMGAENAKVGQVVVGYAERERAMLQTRYPSYAKVRIKASATYKYLQVRVGPKAIGAAAEFGAYNHPVFGRWMSQTRFRRHVWPDWAGNARTRTTDHEAGYLVYETLRKHGDEIVGMYVDKITAGLEVAIAAKSQTGKRSRNRELAR